MLHEAITTLRVEFGDLWLALRALIALVIRLGFWPLFLVLGLLDVPLKGRLGLVRYYAGELLTRTLYWISPAIRFSGIA